MSNQKNTYLALLRGINVGGNHIVKMYDLKICFEEMGFGNVMTYIQSGNVLFHSDEYDLETLTSRIERGVTKRFAHDAKAVVISYKQLEYAVKKAPLGFGKEPAKYRYDVIFLKPPLTAKEAIKKIVVNEKVDQVFAGKDVIYFSRLTELASQSRLSRIIALPIYKNMTIRNWNTTTKLLQLGEV